MELSTFKYIETLSERLKSNGFSWHHDDLFALREALPQLLELYRTHSGGHCGREHIEYLENELENEKNHTSFLGKLLETLCGDGWEKLTIAEAERRNVRVYCCRSNPEPSPSVSPGSR